MATVTDAEIREKLTKALKAEGVGGLARLRVFAAIAETTRALLSAPVPPPSPESDWQEEVRTYGVSS